MTFSQGKLCLLDLDHTLIYGSYAPSENVPLLFEYSEYLKVYKRPFVDEFILSLEEYFSKIIVYTTAKEDYARRIVKDLKIQTDIVLSRQDCTSKNDNYYKTFKKEWGENFDQIYIVDDSPNVWLQTELYEDKIVFMIPKEFRGETNDNELNRLCKEYLTT